MCVCNAGSEGSVWTGRVSTINPPSDLQATTLLTLSHNPIGTAASRMDQNQNRESYCQVHQIFPGSPYLVLNLLNLSIKNKEFSQSDLNRLILKNHFVFRFNGVQSKINILQHIFLFCTLYNWLKLCKISHLFHRKNFLNSNKSLAALPHESQTQGKRWNHREHRCEQHWNHVNPFNSIMVNRDRASF